MIGVGIPDEVFPGNAKFSPVLPARARESQPAVAALPGMFVVSVFIGVFCLNSNLQLDEALALCFEKCEKIPNPFLRTFIYCC